MKSIDAHASAPMLFTCQIRRGRRRLRARCERFTGQGQRSAEKEIQLCRSFR
jgi:hypothetical protein